MKQHRIFSTLVLLTALAVNAVAAHARPAGGGGGGDIVVFDIVGAHDSDSSARPAGGSGGGDIVVFDIVG